MVKNTYGKDWKNWRDPSRLEHHFQTKAALRFSHDREVLGTLSRREKQLTSSATTTLDWDRHNFFNVTLTGDTTFEVINPRYDSDFVLYVKKDDNGTERTLTFPSDWTWLEGSSPDALRYAEERVLIFVYYYNEEYFARFNQFSSSASGYTARDLYSFGAIGDGVADDTEAIRAALDWGASGGENGRAIHVTSGEYLMSSGAATISLPNYSKMAIIGDGAGAGSILVANTQGGIHINCEGSSSIVSIYDLYIPAHYEGAGTLLKVAGQYNGSGGGVDFNTLIVQNVNGTPLQRSTSRYYSLDPFIFTRLKRPYVENLRYTPGKLSFTDSVTGALEPRDWGTALMDLSNSYGPTVIGGKLGGSADYGILMDYTGTISVQEAGEEYATEGGYVHDIRITQTKNSIGYYTDTEQPGLKIDGNHFNSSYRNIVIDGAKRFRIDNNFLYANNDTRYFWSKANPGDTLLTITSDEPHRIPDLTDMLVRVNFSPEDTEDPSYDTDNDGTNDVSPSGTYDVTYISTTSFSIDDPLFAALPQTGNLQVRWSTADFSDNKIINGRHGRISQNMYGFLSSRRRKHWDFEDSESVKADPVLFDIQVYDESLTARTELEPLYIGPTADFITVKLSKITGDGYDRVGYPDNMSIVDDAATRITVIDSEDSFEERNEGGTINLIPNGRFAKGQRGWDRGAGWEVENDNTAADTENSLAVYTATDTSTKNLMMKVPVPCDDRRPVTVDIVYKVQAGTVTTFRPRVAFYDAADALVELKTGVNNTATPSTYTLNRQRIVPPAGAKTMLIGAQAQTSADGVVYVDRIIGLQGTPDFDITDVRAWGAIGDGSDETSVIEAIEASDASYVNLAGLSITTTLSPDVLVKEYFNGRVYGEDVDGNIHLRPNHSVIYDSEILKKSTQTPFLDWEGATILSLGTSIQAEGSGSQDSYPELAAEMLGATCINMAWAGSSAAYDNTGDHTEIGTVKRLSMTQDDVDWGIATWGDVDTNVYSDLYPGINKASKMTMDYRVVAQMAAYSPDVIIIEHNRNDMDRSPGVLENESRTIDSISLGATTTLTLASGGLVIVGDAVRLRVTGISKLDYYVARVQAVSGAQITLNLDSSGFSGSFVSGTCYKVDRQYFCEALGAIISQIYWASTYYGVTTPAIVLTSAPSEYDSDSYDYRVRSNAQYVKDVADYWDVGFFDLNASLAIDANNHTVFLGDTIHPVDLVSRQAIANHLAAYLAGGKLPSLRKAQVLLRAQTNDFNDGASVVYDTWNEGFLERDWKVGTISTVHTDNFSSGLGGYTLTGTAPTTGASPWDGGNTALSCTHDGISGTSYIQKTGLTLGEYTKVSFKIYLDSTVGLTSAGTIGTLSIMHLRTGSVHHSIQLIIKETTVSMRGYVIPAGASPATIVPRSKALSDATVHEITYEVIKGNGTTIDGSCILTFDGERISLPLTFDDSTKSTPDRVFLGIFSNTGDMPIEVWFDDLTIETGSVVTTTVSDFARTLLDDTSQGAMQATLGLVPGTNVQAYDADLATIAGLAGTAGFLKKTAANTWALEDKLSSDSTSMSLAGRLNVTRTGMVWGASNDPILFSQGSASGTITGTDVRAAHMLNVNSDNVNAAAVNGNYNLYVGHTVNGAAAQGHKTALAGVMNVSGTTSNISNKFYTAMAGVAIASANDNGGIGAENGALFGGFLSASLLTGATYWSQICGLEIDMEAQTGLAPKWKTGFQMVQRSTDVEQGTDEDVAVLLANQNGGTAPGWELGFGFGSPHGDWPITATGTLIGTQASVLGGPAYEAAHGIDLRQVAFSGYSFASPGFAVDGLGNMTSNNIVPQPQGRLTLTSGVPSMTANVTAAATVYYAPFKGGFVPLFDGASWKMTSFLASASDAVGLTLALDSDSGHTGYHQSDKNFDLFVFVDAGVVRLGTGPSWSSDTARGTGGGTTELELVDGLHVNKNSMTARFGSASGNTVTVAAQRGLYVGTMRCTANGQTEFNAKPAAAGNGAAAIVGLWNAHNKVDLVAVSRDSDATWTDSAGTWGATDGSATNRISFIAGLAEDAVEVTYNQAVTFGTSGNAQIGVNLDSTSATPGNVIYASTINIVMPLALQDDFVPQIGWHYLQAMQRAASGVTATFYGVSAGLQHQRLSARMRY